MASNGAQPTPGATAPQAPAPTPATVGGPAPAGSGAVGGALVVDPATLAAKLAEMAEEHNVTLEVPAVSDWCVGCRGQGPLHWVRLNGGGACATQVC